MTPREVTVAVQTVLDGKVVAVRVERRLLRVHRRADGSEYIYRNGVRCELVRGLVVVTSSESLIGEPMHHDACPRRNLPRPAPDRWDSTTWDNTKDTSPVWPEAFDAPRTCSYCGGANPDDAIALLRQGWRVVETSKSYKRNLLPPTVAPDNEPHPQPNPPVKVYVHHFTEEQRALFNSYMKD